MLNSTIKFLSALFVAIITIILINFIGNQAITAQELNKDAVTIEIATKETKVIEKSAPENTPQVKEIANTDTEKTETPSFNELLANADLKKGAKLSKKCAACHSFDKAGKHKIGPNLWGIVGSKKASKDGFKYSKALAEFGGIWDYESLDKFLSKPKKFIPKTKMGYAGMKNIEDRAALIAWLREQSDEPFPIDK